MDFISSFILSLLTGELFSRGVGFGEEKLKLHFENSKLSEILNEYDREFSKYYEKEISDYEKEIQTVTKARTLLLSLAKEYMEEDNTDIKSNLKQEFIETTCSKLWISSHIVHKYLDHFYDLVFIKETENIPAEYRALFNRVADTVYGLILENQDQERRISNLEKADAESQDGKKTPADFSSYYEEVERRFTAKKRGEYIKLLGEEPDVSSYIDAFINQGDEQIPVLPFLEDWFVKTEPGAILIHGEPGHGKTMLCNKASFEFYHKRFLTDKAKNVLAVSLNTGKNREIVKEGKVKLSNALVFKVEADDVRTFSFEDCRGALLFLDGFDEFIDKAKEANINNIFSFMEKVDDIAANYGIHIVVLSRTIAVTRNRKDLDASYKYYKLLPVSDEQQDKWLDRHQEYDDYREAFIELRNNEKMQELLRVPFLFRLIVNSKFKITSSNTVELYDNLFTHLMHKRKIDNDTFILVDTGLMDLAFEVYCTDTYMAKIIWDPQWIFAFYVMSDNGVEIGFFHQTFYQYFLAKYIYSGIIKITDDNVEEFIGSFAERELDGTVCQYLAMMFKKTDGSKIHPNIEKIISALVRTEAYINHNPRIKTGDAEKSRIRRSTNIYRNTLHIAAAVSYVIHIPFKGTLDIMIRTYDSNGIMLFSGENKRPDLIGVDLSGANLIDACLSLANLSLADLSRADLSGADLSEADLSGAYLSFANLNLAFLRGANLSKANLRGVDLSGANLNNADLSGADLNLANLGFANLSGANLCKAKLIGADLRGVNLSKAKLIGARLVKADLSRSNLSGANLSGANLNGAIIDIKYKEEIDQSIDGYNFVRWDSDERL